MKKNYISFIVTGIFTIISTITYAQNIGINTNSPDAAAALDVRSASGKKQGVLFPTVALTATGDAATITTPPTGLIVWNDGTGGLSPAGYYYNSGTAGAPSWTKVANGAVMTTTLTNGKIWIGNASNIATEQTMSGDVTMTNVGVTTIGNDKVTSAKILDGTIATVDVASNAIDGTKIDIASTTNGSLMYYNGTDWVNLAPGTAGQILKTNGTAAPTWVDANTTLTKKDITTSTTGVTIGSGTGQVIGASNVTVDVATNSSTSPGLVASGSGQAIKVWGTDASGNPAWKDPNGQLTKKDIVPNTSSVVIVSNGTGQVVGASNVTVDVQGTAGGVLYGKGAGTAAAFNAAGTTGQMLESGVAGAPTWIDKSAILKSQNGLTTVTTGGSATATSPYVELGGSLYKSTTVTQAANTLAFTSTATNGFSVDGTTFSVDAANDRVGIGTAAPGVKLEVNSGGGTNTSLKCEHTGSNFIVRPVSSGGNSTIIENTGGGAIAINPSGGNVGIGTTTINEKLTIAGNASISDANTLEFGKNVSGKEANAGKIGYQTFTTGALDIVGAGTASGSRSVKLWDNVTVSGLAGTGNRVVTANSNGTLETKENSMWTVSSNMGSSPDDLSGGDLTADGADDVTYIRNLGFTVIINGVSYTQVSICTNGWIAFGNVGTTTTTFGAAALPLSFTNNPLIMPYMTDLKDFGSGEWIREYVMNDVYITEWRMRAYTTGTTNWVVRFQVQIHKSGLINVKYYDPMQPQLNGQAHNIDGTSRNTVIGFQTDGGANARFHQITYNAKVMDDNNEISEGWSVSPVR